MLRQQMKPTNRIHCTIVDGGKQPNIIPERAEMCYYIRSLSLEEAEELASRVRKCAEGAALASGTTSVFFRVVLKIFMKIESRAL